MVVELEDEIVVSRAHIFYYMWMPFNGGQVQLYGSNYKSENKVEFLNKIMIPLIAV